MPAKRSAAAWLAVALLQAALIALGVAGWIDGRRGEGAALALAGGVTLGFLRLNALRWRRVESIARVSGGEADKSDAVDSLESAVKARQDEIQHLRRAHAQHQAVLQGMSEGVAALDGSGRVLLMNAAMGEWFGTEPGAARGRRFIDIVRNHALNDLLRETVEKQVTLTREIALFQPGERILEAQAVPILDPEATTYVMVIRDVTEIRRYEKLRKDFVANVSHELKSPLTSIRGMTETLLDGAIEDPQNNRRFLQLIEEDTKRLGRLIDDLLQLSHLDSQELPLRRESVGIAAFFSELLPLFEIPMARRGLTLAVDVPPNAAVAADPERLRRIFINIIDNAVAYNREGGSVAVRVTEEADATAISIEDTGVGIPRKDLEHVFERFYRVDKARSRELGGTGLGLSIVKHLVELHGGSVRVTSEPGKGSTFTVRLPKSTATSDGNRDVTRDR